MALYERRLRPDGFTLIELLTVVAIVAVLVSMLMPALRTARDAARERRCLTNVRQLGVGALNYHADWNMWCVDPGDAYTGGAGRTVGSPWFGARHGKWYDLIYYYAKSFDVFMCTLPTSYYKQPRYDLPGYGLNRWVQASRSPYEVHNYLAQGEPRKVQEFLNPSRKVYFGDTGYTGDHTYVGPSESWTSTFHMGLQYSNRDVSMISARHRQPVGVVDTQFGPFVREPYTWTDRAANGSPGGSNVLYFDGHAAFTRFHDIVPWSYTDYERRYWDPRY